MTIAPGEGERRAQSGLVPQYKVAAEKIYALLSDGRLQEVGIADPKARTLDDIQVTWRRGAQLILDAYQVKWAKPGRLLQDAEFRGLLVELVASRNVILEARANDAEREPVTRVISHLYTSQAPSTAALRGDFAGQGLSLHGFLEAVWRPAERELVRDLHAVDAKWRPYTERLAKECGLDPSALLELAPNLRIDVGRELAEETISGNDWQAQDYLNDLLAIRGKLQDLVSDRRETYVWLTAEELVGHLGDDWKARWQPRLDHVFPTAGPYEPVAATAGALSTALDRYDQGYVVLTGSPGAGKSTLLTRLLRADDRLAARYYAYVPEDNSRLRGEASSFLHDLFLEISGRRGQQVPAPRGLSLDALNRAFHDELAQLGERARRSGRTEIVLIDGLDHVGRDPQPHHSLLKELPLPEAIPQGVLFVIGTRSLGDLPDHVAKAVVGDRHVEAAPLSRKAVIRLCEQAGLGELGERIATLSAGHPLLARTYLGLAAGLEPAARESVLASLPRSSGEVWDFYDTVWETVSDDPEVVELLGMVCRLRGTIRLAWLIETGSGAAEIARLQRLDYLFTRSGGDRWTFFHSSFREYLRTRTMSLMGAPSDALNRGYHEALAGRCRRSSATAPERFDQLHHLVEAGQFDAVLREATPAFFREQVDGLRPRADVAADIRGAARALADCHEPLGIVRLALAAHELEVRGYQFPETTDFLELLVQVGQPELAIAHLGEIDNGTVGHDRRASAMKLALALHDVSLPVEALRVFELHEPLEWLGGRQPGLRQAPGGGVSSLRSWVRAGAVLRGAEYVITSVAALRAPIARDRQREYADVDVPQLRCNLLREAADELLSRRLDESLDAVRAALDAEGPPGRPAIALLDLDHALLRDTRCADRTALSTALAAIDVAALPARGLIRVAHQHLRVGNDALARRLFDDLTPPEVPERDYYGDRDVHQWDTFYDYYRLAARLGQPADPVQAVPAPESEYREQVVIVARHVVAFATLDGRHLAGQVIATSEVVALLHRLHAFWDTGAPSHRADRPSKARSLLSRRAIAMGARLGAGVTRTIFDYFQKRWDEKPAHLLYDSTQLITAFARAGIGLISTRAALAELERLTGQGESSPEDWVALGLTWARLRDTEAASRCCDRAVGTTLMPSSDKDVQLETWTRLSAPLLDGEGGARLAEALASALIELERVSYGGSPELAARALIEQVVRVAPSHAWDLAHRFLDHRLLNADEVGGIILTATAARPTDHWWTALSELQVVLGGDPIAIDDLKRAVVADPSLARRWLPRVVERIAVEGRPTTRCAWRQALLDAVAGTELADVVVIAEDELGIGDETPTSRFRKEESEERATAAPTVEDQLTALEARQDDDYRGREPARALLSRLDELDTSQRARLSARLESTDLEASLHTRLAQAAAKVGDVDTSWREGLEAIACSGSTDWSRDWAGGPIVALLTQLQEVDEPLLRPVLYRRFSELAVDGKHFLSSIGRQLDDYMVALRLPRADTAREVLGVAAAMLRDVAPLPDPASLNAADADVADPVDGVEAFEGLTLWLLGSSYIVAWQAGQRALLEMVLRGGAGATVAAALRGGGPAALRACAIIEAAAVAGVELPELVDPLVELAGTPSLAARLSASRSLGALGHDSPPWPVRTELPAALRIELPSDPGQHEIASGLAASARLFRNEVESLATTAKVDTDALYEYVLASAVRVAGAGEVDDEKLSRRGGIFGWGYLKPSAHAIRTAIDEIAAELVDARRVVPADALHVAGLWPVYDPTLLTMRPTRRPAAVATFVPTDDRRDGELYKRDVTDLAVGAEHRVARSVNGWQVLGERSEIALLDRLGFQEHRDSGSVLVDRENSNASDRLQVPFVPWLAFYYRDLDLPAGDTRCVVQSETTPNASPSGWLGLHPTLARDLDLTPDPNDPFAWLLNDEPAVRSVWWRSGFMRWQPHSDQDEVGEGWLVVASPAVVERLGRLGRVVLSWKVFTVRRGSGETPPAETENNGEFDLPH